MLYNKISRSFILPLSDLYTGWQVSKSLKNLDKSQWWSKERMIDYQNKKLRTLINHAYINVQYYHELFNKFDVNPESIKTKEDLVKIPILTKDDIRENFENGKLLARNYNVKKSRVNSSSGSTGKKTVYRINNEAYGLNIAANLRGWSWMGYRIGDKVVKVTQNQRSSVVKKFQDYVDRTTLFTGEYTEDNAAKFYNLLRNSSRLYLRSYPDPLLYFTKYMDKFGGEIKSIFAINTTGNTLFPEIREKIERIYNSKIFDSYSCEGGANVFECETHENYHIADEYGIYEILDEEGKEVKELGLGRAYVTDLNNYISPFIRYDSKDFLQKGDSCSCGRCLSTVKKVGGRDNDIVITPDNQMLIAQSFTTFFKYIKGINQFQVYQGDKHELVFKLVVGNTFTKDLENDIIRHWMEKTNGKMNVNIKYLESIPVLPSGKVRFVERAPEVVI